MELDIKKLQATPQQAQQTLYPHQHDAIQALENVFDFHDESTTGGLLVLPTGAGKTFTTIKWLVDYVIPEGVRIIWLAHTFHLLDQSFNAFVQNARWIQKRDFVNIRLISSHESHEDASSIDPLTDDILVMTTQTAINNWRTTALDQSGKQIISNFRKFIDHCKTTRLCIVLDEAHHAPAYGCRHLLTDIRSEVPHVKLLGLTATPTYEDETKRGWLKKIFEQEIIYQADQTKLIVQNILARPNFISVPTDREYEVNDSQYNKLVRQHKDMPEEIIDRLASDAPRNDKIVDCYVRNKDKWGKTIIFADRWFQCIYLKEKLKDKGVSANAIFAKKIDKSGLATDDALLADYDTKKIIEQFKDSHDGNGLKVLMNVKMLTEGTDIPDVKTVFITRQTTSKISMTQMIGRAMRGIRAGGGPDKSEANIVFFVDGWKRLINWAVPSLEGGLESPTPVRGYYPLEYISLRLVEELTRQINSGIVFQDTAFSNIVPVGWYQTEIVVVSIDDGSDNYDNDAETQSFVEFVMVYEHTKPKFQRFMEVILNNIDEQWSNESLKDSDVSAQVQTWINTYFLPDTDNIGNTLDIDLRRIARHIAQKGVLPIFHNFDERDQYDLDKLAVDVLDRKLDDFQQDDRLTTEFNKPGSLWNLFYGIYDRFTLAFFGAKQREIHIRKYGTVVNKTILRVDAPVTISDDLRRQVFILDNRTCLACGASGKGVKLEVDHILPSKWGGTLSPDNLQTLCSTCNKEKGVNEINFRVHDAHLKTPKQLALLLRHNQENVQRSITRLVNFFYHCKAVCSIEINERISGSHYSLWKISLYDGNNPDWIMQYKQKLVRHIKEEFNCPQVNDLIIDNNVT